MSFGPDGRTLLSTAGGAAHVWHLVEKRKVQTIETGSAPVTQAIFCGSSQRVATRLFGPGSIESGVALWENSAQTRLKSFRSDAPWVGILCNQDGTRLITRGMLDRVRLIDTKRDILLAEFNQEFGIDPAVFSSDGSRLLLAANSQSELLLVNATSGKSIRSLKVKELALKLEETLKYWDFSSDGRYVVAGSDHGTVYVWNAVDGKEVKAWSAHESSISSATLDKKNQRILVAYKDNTLLILDLQTGRLLATLSGHAATVVKAIFSDAGTDDDEAETVVVSASNDGVVIVWDIATITNPTKTLVFKTNLPGLSDVRLQSSAIIGILGEKGFVVWNGRPSFSAGNMKILAVSADGKIIAYRDRDKARRMIVKVVDIERDSMLSSIYMKGHTDRSPQAALTPDGKRLVTSATDKALRVWDTTTGSLLHSFDGLSAEVTTLAVSPDGSNFAIGLRDGLGSVWSFDPLKRNAELEGHKRTVNSIAFSPNGKSVITTSSDQSYAIWDAASGHNLKQISRENTFFYGAVYNKDATRIVTADDKGLLGISKNTPSARPANQIQRISLNLTTGSGCDGAIGFL